MKIAVSYRQETLRVMLSDTEIERLGKTQFGKTRNFPFMCWASQTSHDQKQP